MKLEWKFDGNEIWIQLSLLPGMKWMVCWLMKFIQANFLAWFHFMNQTKQTMNFNAGINLPCGSITLEINWLLLAGWFHSLIEFKLIAECRINWNEIHEINQASNQLNLFRHSAIQLTNQQFHYHPIADLVSFIPILDKLLSSFHAAFN